MERQARQTDRAIERLGLTTDMVGSPKQTRQVNDLDRSYRSFGRTADDTGGRVRRLSNDMNNNEKRARGLKQAFIETGAAIKGLGAILGLLRLPAMGVGIGVLVQAVGALAGGIIALTPRIADLAGVAAVLPATFTGIGLAMVTVKLATGDLSKALAGNQQAIKRLTPEAKQFLITLREYRPVMKELRTSAQAGLFGGLDRALPTLMRGLPVANTLLRGMSKTLGDLASQAATRFTQNNFLQDLLGLGGAGTRVVGRGGSALLNMVDAFTQLGVAAIPFTDAISKSVVRLSQFVDRWAIFQRDSGRFGAFLDRTRASLHLFGQILGNVWGWFRAIGQAARPLGDMLWRDAERATAAWSKYANSVQGQVRLTREFTSMYPAVHEIVTLFDNVARTIFQMGTSQQLPGIVHSLSGLLPVLQHILNTLVAAFGPQLVAALIQVGQTLDILVGATGPLSIFLTLITNVLGAVNGLVHLIPGLGPMLATAFSVVAIGMFISRLGGVIAGWRGVETAATAAAVAESRALAVGGLGAGVGGRAAAMGEGAMLASITRPGARSAFGPIEGAAVAVLGRPGAQGAFGAAESETAQFAVRPAFYTSGGEGAMLARGAGVFEGASLAGRAGLLGKLGGVAGRFALPITAALGLFGGLTARRSGGFVNQVGQTDLGFLNGITGNLFGKLPSFRGGNLNQFFQTPAQRDQSAVNRSLGALNNSLTPYGGQDPRTYAQLNQQIRLYTQYTQQFGQVATPVYQAATAQLRQQLQALTSVRDRIRETRNEQSRAAAYGVLRQEGQAFDIYAGKYGQAGAALRTNADVLKQMQKIGPAGRQILAQQYLDWLAEESRRNPKLVGAYQNMRDSVMQVFGDMGTRIAYVHGQIVTNTTSTWKSIQKAMTGQAEIARENVNRSFTQVQNKAVAVLEMMGLSPGVARAAVQMAETTGGTISTGAGGYATIHDPTTHMDRPVPGSTAARALRTGTGPTGGPDTNGRGSIAGGLHPGVRQLAGIVQSQFPGLTMTSGVRPGDRSSYHSLGEAVDLAGPSALMNQAARWIGSNLGGSLLEGIHNTGLSVKNGQRVPSGFWGANTWAAHANHIHLAIGDGGMMGGGARGGGGMGTTAGGGGRITAAMLRPRRTTLSGVPGTLADQIGMLYASGMAGRLSGFNATTTGALPSLGSGTTGANQKLAYSMMLKRWPAGEWSSLRSLWMGESGFNALARNPSSGAFGIPQALPPSKMGAAAAGGNAAAQIAWGLNYIAGRYGTPTHAFQQWSTRQPHWYGNGGDFVARKPMVIGVGDNPHGERVTVTPMNKLGTSTRPIELHVHIGTIENHREGDVQRIIHDEFAALARELENMSITGDEELGR